ncbi:MAG: hypothetical protein AAF081_10915 [Actinomycetota bacterium]
MIRRLLLLAAVVLAASTAGRVETADAQSGLDRIDLVSQTTFVTDEPVSFTIRLPNLVPGRQLRVRVFRPIEDPDQILDTIENPR